MLKKIRITIKTTKRAAQKSLFDGAPVNAPSTPEVTEFTTEGNWRDDGTHVYITYREGELSGMGRTTTVLSFDKKEQDVLTLTRSGGVRTAMVFEKGKRHLSLYETPIMPFELALYTKTVENTLTENGALHLLYTVELKGGDPEENDFSLTVLPYFDKPQGK